MYAPLFNDFLLSSDTLQVYNAGKLLFASTRDRLLPLVEYIDGFAHNQRVVIFDKIVGNAAALLAVKANCREIYSRLGSQLAVKTLDRFRIKYHLGEIVPYIEAISRGNMCPMEKLSMDKGPKEFYAAVTNIIRYRQRGNSA